MATVSRNTGSLSVFLSAWLSGLPVHLSVSVCLSVCQSVYQRYKFERLVHCVCCSILRTCICCLLSTLLDRCFPQTSLWRHQWTPGGQGPFWFGNQKLWLRASVELPRLDSANFIRGLIRTRGSCRWIAEISAMSLFLELIDFGFEIRPKSHQLFIVLHAGFVRKHLCVFAGSFLPRPYATVKQSALCNLLSALKLFRIRLARLLRCMNIYIYIYIYICVYINI